MLGRSAAPSTCNPPEGPHPYPWPRSVSICVQEIRPAVHVHVTAPPVQHDFASRPICIARVQMCVHNCSHNAISGTLTLGKGSHRQPPASGTFQGYSRFISANCCVLQTWCCLLTSLPHTSTPVAKLPVGGRHAPCLACSRSPAGQWWARRWSRVEPVSGMTWCML